MRLSLQLTILQYQGRYRLNTLHKSKRVSIKVVTKYAKKGDFFSP